MVKVKKISVDSSSTPAMKTFSKNRSFSGVDSKKSPKSRRKSIATILPTPFKHKTKKGHTEWTISKQVIIEEFARKKKKIPSNEEKLNVTVLYTPKISKKKQSSQDTSDNTLNSSLKSTPRIIQKKNSNTSIRDDILDINVSLRGKVKGAKDKKKSKLPASPTIISDDKDDYQDVIKKLIRLPSPIAFKKKKEIQSHDRLTNTSFREKVKVRDIEKAVRGIIKFRSENPELKNELFAEHCPLFLQISCIKLPTGNSKILRIPLPHSVLTPEDEVCLIVPEVKGIKNIEHDKHVKHYEELLHNKGVTNIKKIMTCHELRTEYETFEQRSRLVDLYDIFLVDGKVSGKIVKKCGKSFYKNRKVPIPVKLQATKLKEHIEKSLSKVFFFLHLKGDSYTVQFGHDKMNVEELVENIYSIIEFLDKQFPGGFENFRGIQVCATRAGSIPIYLNFKSSNEVAMPNVTSKKPKAYKIYKDELTTLHNAEVTVIPTGEVLVKRLRGKKYSEDDIITDSDIIRANRDSKEKADNENGIKKKSRKRNQNDSEDTEDGVLKKKNLDEKDLVTEDVVNKKKAKKVETTDSLKEDRVIPKKKVKKVEKDSLPEVNVIYKKSKKLENKDSHYEDSIVNKKKVGNNIVLNCGDTACELTTLHNAEVTVKPTGQVLVKRLRGEKYSEDDVITDSDIIRTNMDSKENADDKNGIKKKSRKRNQNDGEDTEDGVLKNKKLDEKDLVTEDVVNKKKPKKGETTDSLTEDRVIAKKKLKKVEKTSLPEVNVIYKKKAKKLENKDSHSENSIVNKKKVKVGNKVVLNGGDTMCELKALHIAEVTVKPTGEVLVKRLRGKKYSEDDVITDSNIIRTNKDSKEKADDENGIKKKSRKHNQNDGENTEDGVLKNKKLDEKHLVTEDVVNKKKPKKVETTDSLTEDRVIAKKKVKKVEKTTLPEVNVIYKKKAKKLENKDSHSENSIVNKNKVKKVGNNVVLNGGDKKPKLDEKVSTKQKVSKEKFTGDVNDDNKSSSVELGSLKMKNTRIENEKANKKKKRKLSAQE